MAYRGSPLPARWIASLTPSEAGTMIVSNWLTSSKALAASRHGKARNRALACLLPRRGLQRLLRQVEGEVDQGAHGDAAGALDDDAFLLLVEVDKGASG